MKRGALLKSIAVKLKEAEEALKTLENLGDYRVMNWGRYYTPEDLAVAIKHLRTVVEIDAKVAENERPEDESS